MSIELILGLVTLVLTVALPVWLLRNGDLLKRSMPSKNIITFYALKVLVATQNNSPTANTGLTYRQLYEEIIEDYNSNTDAGNFDPGHKNKTLHSYIKDSIKRLADPKPEKLKPLIEPEYNKAPDHRYSATKPGLHVFDELPLKEPDSNCAKILKLYLSGIDMHLSRSPAVADQVTTVQAAKPHKTPKTPNEWRHRVFMEMPEDEALELKDLQQLISQKLSLSGLKRPTHAKVEQAIQWNLESGNLLREDDSRIRLATPKSDKTLDDFK